MMEKTILIGQKLTRKSLLSFWLMSSFFGIFGALGYMTSIAPHFSFGKMMNIMVAVLIYIGILIFLTPIVTSSKYMELNSKEFICFETKGFFQQMRVAYDVLLGRELIANIVVKTENIMKVNVSYFTYRTTWSYECYQVKLTFLLKDGTTFIVSPSQFDNMRNAELEAALKYLEKQGVEIVDKLELRKAMCMNNEDYYAYVQNIEKRQRL